MSDVGIRLRTFGGVDLTGPDAVRVRPVAAQPKRLALLLYLAAAQPHGFHRKDSLLALFWPESAEGPARRALNRAVYFLRHELGRDVVLSRGDQEIAASDEVVWSDVGAFGRALDDGRLEEALDLYRGAFAPGFFVDGLAEFERWMESERARLQERALQAALALARREEERGALDAAGSWSRRATTLAPHDERAARRRMALLDRAGDRAGALDSYAVLAERLRDDFGVEPSPETQALEAAVRSRRSPVGIAAAVAPGVEPPAPVSPSAGGFPSRTAAPSRVTSPRLAWAAGGAAAVAVALAVGMSGHQTPPVALGHRSAVAVAGAFERWPALSPDGRAVYYTLTEPSGDELYVQQVESGAPLALTLQLPGGQRGAAVSPDGTRLLFLGDSGLYLMPSLGGESRRVVVARIPADAVNDPGLLPGAWAPDGRRIAYPDSDTLFVQLLGTRARTAVAVGGGLHSPAWSSDGRWIAFVRGNYAFHIRGNRASSAIMVVRSTGGPSLALTDTSALHTSPVWVPGQQTLLYISDRDGGRDVYQVRLGRDGRPHGPGVRLTTGLEPERLSISADGRRLAWSVFTESSNLWALDIPARDSVPLSSASPITTGRQFIEAVGNVSPDGTWLYFHSDRAGDADLWRLPLAGGQAERLTTDSALDFAPTVSPDGRDVAFHSLRHDRRDIYVMPVAGGPQVRVSVGDPQGGVPAWSADGRALAWLSGSAVRMSRRNTEGTWTAPRLVIAGYGPGGWAQWSPDGRWISYPMLAGLTLVDPETHSTRLLAGTVGLRWHVWARDGRLIYGMRELDDQRIQMLSIPVAGGPPRPIAWADHPLTQQARYGLALHQGRLYFPLVERSADVWVGDIVGR